MSERRQKTIHVDGLPPLTLKIESKCGIVQVHPDLTKHFPDLPKEWEGCDVLMLVTGVPDWGSIGTLTYTYSEKYGIGFREYIFLWEDFRGKGIAREMSQFAIEDMKQRGIQRIYTSITTPAWIPRMEAAGFKLVEGTERLYVLNSEDNPGSNPGACELTDGVPIPSDYQWHYDPTPLHKLQELVDGLDWISETYIFGGYARALLGYPPFPEREKFGPGHDIDFVTSPKYPEALELMRKEGIQPWEGFTKHMSLKKAWEWHEKEIKKGFLPIPIMQYMLEKQEKIGPYYLSWGWEKHMIDFETDMPIIRIKPKPLIVYQKARLEKSSSNRKAEPLIPYWAIPIAFTLILVGVSFAGWVASQLEGEA